MRPAVVLAASCSFVSGQSPENFQLFSVNKDNFAEVSKGKTVLLRFCDPSLPQCMAISPTWDSLTQAYKQILIGDVDCGGAGKSLCDAQGVSSYPTFKFGQPDQLQKYDGATDDKALRQLARSTASGVQAITTQFPSEFLARAPASATAESSVPSPAPSQETTDVSCGKTRAATCSACPKKEGSVTWCSGDCLWDERQQVCATKKSIVDSLPATTVGADNVPAATPAPSQDTGDVSCGKTRAATCSACPKKEGSVTWCSGDCLWDERQQLCATKKSIVDSLPSTTFGAEGAAAPPTQGGSGSGVSCGKTRADSCSSCPKVEGSVTWCSGDCLWNEQAKTCADKAVVPTGRPDSEMTGGATVGGAVGAVGSGVSCGKTRADTCRACPKIEGSVTWCSGDCLWNEQAKTCADKTAVPTGRLDSEMTGGATIGGGVGTAISGVSCGKTRADSCSACPKVEGSVTWCSGDCLWNEQAKTCADKAVVPTGRPDSEMTGGATVGGAIGAVSCGRTRADTCAACPKLENDDNAAHWCSGDCLWNEKDKVCSVKSAVPEPPSSELKAFQTNSLGPNEGLSCGKRSRALSCGECPKLDGVSVAIWCNGDCLWNEKEQVCVARSTITEAMKAHEL